MADDGREESNGRNWNSFDAFPDDDGVPRFQQSSPQPLEGQLNDGHSFDRRESAKQSNLKDH